MTRLFRRTTPRLATWTPRAESERPASVVDQDAQEHKAAARFDRFGQRRVGDRYYELSDLPDERDA